MRAGASFISKLVWRATMVQTILASLLASAHAMTFECLRTSIACIYARSACSLSGRLCGRPESPLTAGMVSINGIRNGITETSKNL